MKRDSVLHVRLLSVQGKPVLTSRSSSAVKRVCGLSSISDRNPIDIYILTYCPGCRSCGMTLVHVLLSVVCELLQSKCTLSTYWQLVWMKPMTHYHNPQHRS